MENEGGGRVILTDRVNYNCSIYIFFFSVQVKDPEVMFGAPPPPPLFEAGLDIVGRISG